MQESPTDSTEPTGRARSLANLRPPWQPGETGNAKGPPRKGTSKLSKVFSRRSLMALRELGIDIPGKVRIDENVIRDCCRALAPEMIERLRWIASQAHDSDYVGAARAAAADLLKYAGVEVLQVEHTGVIQHQHAAMVTGAFLDDALGRLSPPIEGELSTGEPEPEPFNITPVTRSNASYQQADEDMHRLCTGSDVAITGADMPISTSTPAHEPGEAAPAQDGQR